MSCVSSKRRNHRPCNHFLMLCRMTRQFLSYTRTYNNKASKTTNRLRFRSCHPALVPQSPSFCLLSGLPALFSPPSLSDAVPTSYNTQQCVWESLCYCRCDLPAESRVARERSGTPSFRPTYLWTVKLPSKLVATPIYTSRLGIW